jgi:hypothetical protein
MFLAYHHTVRNSKGDSRLTAYKIAETENEAIEFLFSQWSKEYGYDIDIEKCRQGFRTVFESLAPNKPVWQWEYIRKGNGDLFGFHKLEDSTRFDVDLQLLREKALLLEWNNDDSPIISDFN